MPTLTTLVGFNGFNGLFPDDVLIADAAGDLFGTTSGNGSKGENPDGTVFEIANTSTGYASFPTTLVSFNGTDGANPWAGLIADAAGNLFGTTEGGGANGEGTVFEIAKTSTGYATTPTKLVSFDGTNGEFPSAGLTADAAGNLFGTTVGGFKDDGTVFEITNTSTGYAHTPITLVSFNGTNGESPKAGLISNAAGDLFGTTSRGGPNFDSTSFLLTGDGTVFEIANSSTGYASTPATLVSFNGTNGSGPFGGLIADADADLFGTTEIGGTSGDGTVFGIASTGTGYADTPITLVSFNGADGAYPGAGLLTNRAGDLFGTTTQDGAGGQGTVFELTGTGFPVICYLAGTRIATPAGESAVEQLVVGDAVMTLQGAARRIVWIGIGRVLAARGRRSAATPVIVRKNALADNVPYRDLRVTKAHSLYIDGVLIPVEFPVNHRTILWDDNAQEVTIYHIELETHDVLLANGAPAESYRDDGNRWLFQNANSGWSLPPQEPCAPVLTGGPVVDAVWQRLLERAGPRKRRPLTKDADFHVLADGRRIDAARRDGGAY